MIKDMISRPLEIRALSTAANPDSIYAWMFWLTLSLCIPNRKHIIVFNYIVLDLLL